MASAEQHSLYQNYKQQSGWKELPNQFASYPFIRHLFFADKKDLTIPKKDDELDELINYLASNRKKYQQFLRQKKRFPSFDVYACFQPFNEAFKALFPFVNIIRRQVKKGDTILNLWDRSGWTASMLGGWFPKQQIVTVWEGDKDVLGYKGFDYWMSDERRKNHSVVFADFLRPLPFDNASVAAVIGMDLLHRFNQPELLSEIHRIAKADAPIIFPHVHLTNSMPEPFFERGCRQLHGTDYQEMFDKLEKFTHRKGYILSEPETFNWNDSRGSEKKKLISAPSNPDYNACIAWLPADKEYELEKWKGHEQEDWQNMYLLQNPFLILNPVSHTIEVKEEGWGENIFELFSRHPVYSKKINASIGIHVEEDIRCVLYLASHGYNVREIMEKAKITDERMQQILEQLLDLDLAQCVPVDEAGFRLQTLLGQQEYLLASEENNLSLFWKQTVDRFEGDVWCKMGEDELTYSQADELVELVRKALQIEGLKKGDKVLLCGELHSEFLLMFWAAVKSGLIVVPLSAKQSAEKIREYIEVVQPKLILCEPEIFKNIQSSSKTIMVDDAISSFYQAEYSFEQWLEQSFDKERGALSTSTSKPEDVAVILWTTGSTGNPKGVPITHSQLIRSGRLMTETYHWKKTDRYYALGGLETMSGLRHATVAIAEVGACCIIPVKPTNISDHIKNITANKATILTANPAFYKHFVLSIKNQSKLQLSIRLALCTGNKLTSELRQMWKEITKTSLYNYYGLTETGGICIAELLGNDSTEKETIGKPIDCLVKIIDEAGNELPPEEPGELCIYSTGIFTGYYNNPSASNKVLKNGWFKTGDIAVLEKDGSVSLGARLSNVVKLISGERVEIDAIEEAIEQIEGLNDWAVCPIKKAERESIAVFLVLKEGTVYENAANEVKKMVSQKLGSFAVPSFIEAIDIIPRGNHNKVLQKELSEKYLTIFNT